MKPCFIDAHCHIEMIEFATNQVVENAYNSDVKLIVAQGVNPESNRKVLEIALKFETVKAAMGIYPIDSLKLSEKEIDNEIDFIRKNKENVSAIGEVGLDFKETEDRMDQSKTFEKFIDLSIELDVPIIIHSRKAEKECIEILEKKKAKKVIMHCFSGKLSLVKKIIENGWYLTIPTSVKNSEHFQKVIDMTPLEKLFCETDSPYLHPDKEWPNQPTNVIESYKKIAEIKKINIEKVKEIIYSNYTSIFLD